MKISLFFGAILLFAAIGGAYFFGTKQNTINTLPVAPAGTTTPVTPSASPTAQVPTDPNIKTFTSSELGISFQYQEMQNGEKFAAKQVGNKVYVYQAKYSVDQGQYVEVFTKDPADDLKTAIEKKFLSNYSKTDCFVEIVKNPVAGQTLPFSYLMAQINYPPPGNQNDPFWANADKCPSPYTTTNGIAYFLMDSTRHGTFVFLSIGQYAIDAGPSLPWQSTIKFL